MALPLYLWRSSTGFGPWCDHLARGVSDLASISGVGWHHSIPSLASQCLLGACLLLHYAILAMGDNARGVTSASYWSHRGDSRYSWKVTGLPEERKRAYRLGRSNSGHSLFYVKS